MENRFAVNTPEYRDAFLRQLQGKEITAEEKVSEIARLIGGDTITGTTLESARELINQSV